MLEGLLRILSKRAGEGLYLVLLSTGARIAARTKGAIAIPVLFSGTSTPMGRFILLTQSRYRIRIFVET